MKESKKETREQIKQSLTKKLPPGHIIHVCGRLEETKKRETKNKKTGKGKITFFVISRPEFNYTHKDFETRVGHINKLKKIKVKMAYIPAEKIVTLSTDIGYFSFPFLRVEEKDKVFWEGKIVKHF